MKTGDKKYLDNNTPQVLTEKRVKTYFLRRIVRTLTWTNWWKLPLTFLKPDVIAVGHNEIVRQMAKKSRQRVFFYQASELLRKINKKNIDFKASDYVAELCQETYDVLVGNLKIKACYAEEFNYLASSFIKQSLFRDAEALEKCYQYSKLPTYIWIGAGTSYDFRLLALAVLRKGGKTTGFAHATGKVLWNNYSRDYFGEFAVTTEFVEITPKAKECIHENFLKQFPKPLNNTFTVSSIVINNELKKYQNGLNKNKIRPTIVYTSTAIKDMIRSAPCANYMAYLYWQLKLTDILDKMDIDLICQPHPEGLMTDKSLIHPLRKKYNTPYRSFEQIMTEADVFLVDYIHSTTFGEMLVTEKPIVRIAWLDESTYYGIPESLKFLMAKRCRNVKADFDENNLPYIDSELLEKALTENWQEKVDSSDFRELLIG